MISSDTMIGGNDIKISIKIAKKDYKERFVKDTKAFLKKKRKKGQYWREQYRNLPEDEKQRLVDKKYQNIRKSTSL